MDTTHQRLAVGFLGTGYIADWHAKALQSVRSAKLIAVCDRDEMQVRAFAVRKPRQSGVRLPECNAR